jgi:hypothetical protein
MHIQKTLNLHFGKLIVLIFYAEWNQQSVQFKSNMLTSIPLFGQFDNVAYITASAETCPDIFKVFSVEFVPTVIFTDALKNVIKKFETEDIGIVLDALA